MSGPDRRLTVYEQLVVYNDARHRFIASLLPRDVPAVVVVNRVDHGRELLQWLPSSVYLSGDSSKTERARVLEEFNAGAFNCLIVTKIMDRGTNELGRAVALMFVSGEGSTRQTLQRVGRGLRRTDGKEYLQLIDIMDTGWGYLRRAARARLKLYNAQGFAININNATHAAAAPSQKGTTTST